MLEVLSLIHHQLMAIHIQAKDQDEVIRELGKYLVAHGKVNPAYIEDAVEREGEFPTGLPTTGIGVALPHAGDTHVISSALAIGVLEQPVIFQKMGSPEQAVAVQVVFIPAVKEGASQMEALEGIALLLKNDEFLNQAVACTSAEDLYRVTVEAVFSTSTGEPLSTSRLEDE